MTSAPTDLPRLSPRTAESHKGDYGRALLLGGSRGMSGAIALSGMAALRAGAGLVTLGVPTMCLETVAGFEPCFMTVPLPCDEHGCLGEAAAAAIQPWIARADVVACGPGLGRGPGVSPLVRSLYTSVTSPLVIDADGLNALAEPAGGLAEAGGPRIITPHPGEFQRLCGGDAQDPRGQQDPAGQQMQAVEMARAYRIVVVLKGHRTLITDGRRWVHNTTGNPGMATAGSGDVLTGILTALLGQGLDTWEAARLGVYLHGLAGDVAARRHTQVAMTARDLVQFLPAAWQELGY
ncbi:MAG: NAD(P)H-hydrate dehydratase [Pirellulaceae bacterium]